MTNWQSKPAITKAEFNQLTAADHKLIYADQNKWEYDYGSERWLNLHHPDNDEMLQQRQVVETRAYLGHG